MEDKLIAKTDCIYHKVCRYVGYNDVCTLFEDGEECEYYKPSGSLHPVIQRQAQAVEEKYNILWVARDKNGLLNLFASKPFRERTTIMGEIDCWDCNEIHDELMELSEDTFQNITWKSEPLKVEIKPVYE